MGHLNLPAGVKLFGTNLIPKPADVVAESGGFPWVRFIENWDWTNWVRPQIDFMCGNGIGCNAVRLIGGMDGVATGRYSQATYDSRVLQLADYCASQGLYYQHCGAGFNPNMVTAFTTAGVQGMADILATTLTKLQPLGNLVGCDLIQELAFSNLTATQLQQFIVAVRARVPDVPLTYSGFSALVSSTGSPDIQAAGVEGLLDYFDFHFYYGPQTRPVSRSTLDYYLTRYPNHDILIGEFGVHQATAADLQTSDLTEFLNVCNDPHPRIRGGMAWASFDQRDSADGGTGTPPFDDIKWGFWTGPAGATATTARSNKLAVLRRFTGGSARRASSPFR